MSGGYGRLALESRASLASSRLMALRIKSDLRFLPTSSSIASIVAWGRRMVVSFIKSDGRPMRRGVAEIGISVNKPPNSHLKTIAKTLRVNDSHYKRSEGLRLCQK